MARFNMDLTIYPFQGDTTLKCFDFLKELAGMWFGYVKMPLGANDNITVCMVSCDCFQEGL